MSDTVARIKEYIDYKGVSVRRFEEINGFSNGSFASQYKNKKSIGVDKVENILHNFKDLNPVWLLTGVGEMEKSDGTTVIVNKIPYYKQVATAGQVMLFKDFTTSQSEGYISVPNMPKCDGAVPIVGDSMYPLLKSGDIVCYKLKDPSNIIYGEMYLIDWTDSDGDDFLMAKFLGKGSSNKHVKLVSHNKHHDDMEIEIKNIRQIALIKSSVRFNTH